mgnify:CR=1 FL=1
MTEKCQVNWQPTEDQVDKIIIPAMQDLAQQYAGYGKELLSSPGFIAVMLRDIADAFTEQLSEGENSCDYC